MVSPKHLCKYDGNISVLLALDCFGTTSMKRIISIYKYPDDHDNFTIFQCKMYPTCEHNFYW